MTNTKGASKIVHPWSADALLAKAQRYAEEMQTYSPEDWQFGLASTFVLEFLSRAALAHVSPALLAESANWNNIYFAIGGAPKASKFIPRSIDISSVVIRLRDIIPEFTPEEEGFAAQHINRRNEELHTGGVPFDGANPSWLGLFYHTCAVLLKTLEKTLPDLLGQDEAKIAAKIIDAYRDESAKTVMKTITAHKMVWEASSGAERQRATHFASDWATREKGHRVKCPSCGNDALLGGESDFRSSAEDRGGPNCRNAKVPTSQV